MGRTGRSIKTLSCVLFLLPDGLTRENSDLCVPASLRPCSIRLVTPLPISLLGGPAAGVAGCRVPARRAGPPRAVARRRPDS